MASTLSHIREIERVAMGDAGVRHAPVAQFWLRYLDDDRLDPAIAQEAGGERYARQDPDDTLAGAS